MREGWGGGMCCPCSEQLIMPCEVYINFTNIDLTVISTF